MLTTLQRSIQVAHACSIRLRLVSPPSSIASLIAVSSTIAFSSTTRIACIIALAFTIVLAFIILLALAISFAIAITVNVLACAAQVKATFDASTSPLLYGTILNIFVGEPLLSPSVVNAKLLQKAERPLHLLQYKFWVALLFLLVALHFLFNAIDALGEH